jgi:hypothetical protein
MTPQERSNTSRASSAQPHHQTSNSWPCTLCDVCLRPLLFIAHIGHQRHPHARVRCMHHPHNHVHRPQHPGIAGINRAAATCAWTVPSTPAQALCVFVCAVASSSFTTNNPYTGAMTNTTHAHRAHMHTNKARQPHARHAAAPTVACSTVRGMWRRLLHTPPTPTAHKQRGCMSVQAAPEDCLVWLHATRTQNGMECREGTVTCECVCVCAVRPRLPPTAPQTKTLCRPGPAPRRAATHAHCTAHARRLLLLQQVWRPGTQLRRYTIGTRQRQSGQKPKTSTRTRTHRAPLTAVRAQGGCAGWFPQANKHMQRRTSKPAACKLASRQQHLPWGCTNKAMDKQCEATCQLIAAAATAVWWRAMRTSAPMAAACGTQPSPQQRQSCSGPGCVCCAWKAGSACHPDHGAAHACHSPHTHRLFGSILQLRLCGIAIATSRVSRTATAHREACRAIPDTYASALLRSMCNLVRKFAAATAASMERTTSKPCVWRRTAPATTVH